MKNRRPKGLHAFALRDFSSLCFAFLIVLYKNIFVLTIYTLRYVSKSSFHVRPSTFSFSVSAIGSSFVFLLTFVYRKQCEFRGSEHFQTLAALPIVDATKNLASDTGPSSLE